MFNTGLFPLAALSLSSIARLWDILLCLPAQPYFQAVSDSLALKFYPLKVVNLSL